MSTLYDFLVQVIPIMLGIVLMFIINTMKFRRSKIRIRSSSEILDNATVEVSTIQSNSQETGAEVCKFEEEARSRLIEDGCMGGRSLEGNIRNLAFERLGIMECGRLKDLGDLARQNHCTRLNVFVRDEKELLRHMLYFSLNSGVLLSYLASYKLDTFGA